jgi:secreted trypsin-like serine protease
MRQFLAIFCLVLLASCGSDGDADNAGKCSALDLAESTTAKIVNGTQCGTLNKSPVVVILRNTPDGKTGLCSGTMLSPNKVLTAAHCLDGASSVDILFGTTTDKFAFVTASSWNIHPTFARANFLDDVGIVHSPVSIPVPNLPILTSNAPKIGDKVSIFGYGATSGGASVDGKLRVGSMTIGGVDNNRIYAYFDASSSNTCSGDSGGPMLLQVDGQQAIVGTTSYGSSTNCSVGELSAFANLQSPATQNFIRSVAPDARFQ